MAKSKKKSLSQKVVGVATTGMPSPVRSFLTNRAIALLIVLPHGDPAKPSSFAVDLQPDGKFGHKVAERVEGVRDRFSNSSEQGLSLLPTSAEQESQNGQATRPLARLKQLFER